MQSSKYIDFPTISINPADYKAEREKLLPYVASPFPLSFYFLYYYILYDIMIYAIIEKSLNL